jgi:hypothetical protein
MSSAADLRRIALLLEGTNEAPHFDRAAFKVSRIYETRAFTMTVTVPFLQVGGIRRERNGRCPARSARVSDRLPIRARVTSPTPHISLAGRLWRKSSGDDLKGYQQVHS